MRILTPHSINIVIQYIYNLFKDLDIDNRDGGFKLKSVSFITYLYLHFITLIIKVAKSTQTISVTENEYASN